MKATMLELQKKLNDRTITMEDDEDDLSFHVDFDPDGKIQNVHIVHRAHKTTFLAHGLDMDRANLYNLIFCRVIQPRRTE